jgi:hypothetical protein
MPVSKPRVANNPKTKSPTKDQITLEELQFAENIIQRAVAQGYELGRTGSGSYMIFRRAY